MKCEYCKSKFIEDSRGNCSACGAPMSEYAIEENNTNPWWKRIDLIGDSRRKQMRSEGTWQEWKRKNAPWLIEERLPSES